MIDSLNQANIGQQTRRFITPRQNDGDIFGTLYVFS